MYHHANWTLISRLSAGGYYTEGDDWTKVKVKCIPLYTLMTAVNMTDLDYISMDIEGVELKVLQTLPFDKIRVKVRFSLN